MINKSNLFESEQNALALKMKALSHPARIAIVELLAEEDTCICGEITDRLPLAQATVSQHLKVLKEAGLIQGTVDGPSVCYCLDKPQIEHFQRSTQIMFEKLLRVRADSECC